MVKTIFEQIPIHHHFGAPAGSMVDAEKKYIDEAVRAFKQGSVVHFPEMIHRNQWHYFNEQTKGIEGLVQLSGPLPKDWNVDGKKTIKVFNELIYKEASELLTKRKHYDFHYSRDANNLDKHFLMTYGTNREHERECVIQALERLHVLDNSIYSRPKINESDEILQEQVNIDYIFPIRNGKIRYRNIEDTDQHLTRKYLFDQNSILPVFDKMSKRVHCWAVLDVFPFNDELNGMPSEKFLWPVFFGVPFIYIGYKNQKEVLKEWGFEPSDPCRDNVRSTVEQMMWLKSIFDDPALAQQWQDSQGERVIANWRALKNLPDRIQANSLIRNPA